MEGKGVQFTLRDVQCKLAVNAEVSMIDGKMADFLQGDSDAYCHYCNITKSDGNDVERLLDSEGFPITKTADQIKIVWKTGQ